MANTETDLNTMVASQYRVILEERARTLRLKMSTPTAQLVARIEEPNDNGELADRSHTEWLFLNRNAATTRELHEIEQALERIEEGTYGICMECERPITPKRLDAVPWARYCVACQEQHGSWRN